MSSKMSIQEHMELAMMEKRYKSLPFLATDEAKLKEWIELVKNTRPLYPHSYPTSCLDCGSK